MSGQSDEHGDTGIGTDQSDLDFNSELDPIPCTPDQPSLPGTQGTDVSCTFDASAAGLITFSSSYPVQVFSTTDLSAPAHTDYAELSTVSSSQVSVSPATATSGTNYQFTATLQQAFTSATRLIFVVNIPGNRKAKTAANVNP